MFQSHLSSCHISAPCQTVVVSIYIVKVLCLLKNALHSLDGALFLPVATFRCYYLDARIWFDGIHKTTMTLHGWRRTFQATNLNDASLAFELMSNKSTHRLTNHIVVATYECCIFVGIGLTVIENHGYSLIVSTLHSLRYSTQLIRRNDKQVYTLVDKLVYLLILQYIIIIRRCELHDDRVVEILAHLQFVVELVAPNILGALRYSDNKLLRFLCTRSKHHHEHIYK